MRMIFSCFLHREKKNQERQKRICVFSVTKWGEHVPQLYLKQKGQQSDTRQIMFCLCQRTIGFFNVHDVHLRTRTTAESRQRCSLVFFSTQAKNASPPPYLHGKPFSIDGVLRSWPPHTPPVEVKLGRSVLTRQASTRQMNQLREDKVSCAKKREVACWWNGGHPLS